MHSYPQGALHSTRDTTPSSAQTSSLHHKNASQTSFTPKSSNSFQASVKMKFLTIIPVLAQLALAAPAPAPVGTGELIFPEGFNSTGLEKRQGDGSGIHLVNCNGFSGEGGVSPKQSFVLYCANDNDCNKFPDMNNVCKMMTNGYFTWEGAAQGCTFPTGVKFQWWIRPDAQSQPNYAHVGDGGNQYRAYAGYKDDKHTMFNWQGPSRCDSIYYFI